MIRHNAVEAYIEQEMNLDRVVLAQQTLGEKKRRKKKKAKQEQLTATRHWTTPYDWLVVKHYFVSLFAAIGQIYNRVF